MYYVLTRKGLDRVEEGLPDKHSDYFLVLGAIADLEEQWEGSKAFSERDILREMGKAPNYVIFLTLKSLVKSGLVEEVQRGDERFNW